MADRNYLTEEEVNALIRAMGGKEHAFPAPEISYDRHRNHKDLTYLEFWKDWASWLGTCKWDHLSLLRACQDSLEAVLRTRSNEVIEEIRKAFSRIDFSNTRGEQESSENLKYQVTNLCQLAYRAYSSQSDALIGDLYDLMDWVLADAEVNFAYMAVFVASKSFYFGTDKERLEL
jgi:hypothetical protein